MNTHFISTYACLIFLICNTQANAQDLWKTYSFSEAGCQILFPTQPTTAQEDNVWTAQAKSEGNIYQVVVYLNKLYTNTNVEDVLKESVEGFINPATDEIVKREDIQVNGVLAKQILVRSQDGTFLVFRTWVGKDKLYQVAIAGTNSNTTITKSQKFLEGLKTE